MFVVRAVRENDLDGLYTLAQKAGAGLTTLPAHRPSLEEKIAASLSAFSAHAKRDEKQTYLLVMENKETGQVIGTSAVMAGVGLDRPFYTYRMLHLTQVSTDPIKRVDTQLLQLSNDFIGASEMATLFLDPEFRVGGLGKLLAKARYLLIASHLERFNDPVISEIRGWTDENENSPFWDAIGRHFFQMDFSTADRVNGEGNFQFINDLMPKFPIYTSLLPEAAQQVIGKPHNNSRPAIRLLEREGFRFSGAVDIFDAGPAMEADRKGIWTIRNSNMLPLAGEADVMTEPTHLVANADISRFAVTISCAEPDLEGLYVSAGVGEKLNAAPGDMLCYAPLNYDDTADPARSE